MSWKLALLGGALYSAMPLAAYAEVELSSQDLAYVTAQQIQFEQGMLQAHCARSSLGKDIERRHGEFVSANPGFRAALAAEPTDPAAKTRAEALIKRHEEGVGMVMRMASAMPPEMFCASALQSKPVEFTARVAKVRAQAARIDPPPPVDPDAGIPEVRLPASDLNEVVRQVLEHADVGMYLHPEVPGRVPVRVALAAPYSSERIDLVVYGQPVRDARAADASAVQLTVRATERAAKVTVAYAPEGIHGTVRLTREGTAWRVSEAKIYE